MLVVAGVDAGGGNVNEKLLVDEVVLPEDGTAAEVVVAVVDAVAGVEEDSENGLVLPNKEAEGVVAAAEVEGCDVA